MKSTTREAAGSILKSLVGAPLAAHLGGPVVCSRGGLACGAPGIHVVPRGGDEQRIHEEDLTPP